MLLGHWKLFQQHLCRPHKAVGIKGVVDIATRHVHCCEIIAKQVIWLRISGVFINTAYDEGLSKGMGYYFIGEAWWLIARGEGCRGRCWLVVIYKPFLLPSSDAITVVGLVPQMLVHRWRPGQKCWLSACDGRDMLTQFSRLIVWWCHHSGLGALAIVLSGVVPSLLPRWSIELLTFSWSTMAFRERFAKKR